MKHTYADLPVTMMGEPDHVVAKFWELVDGGESQKMAEIFACRHAPGAETDTSHFAGMPALDTTCGPSYAQEKRRQARAAGISITDSSIFNGSIADDRQGGDPGAWLLAGDGRAKFKDVIEHRGGSCESLGVKANGKSLELAAIKRAGIAKRKAMKASIAAERRDKMKA